VAGYLLLTAAYLAISAALLTGAPSDAVLAGQLAVGGLGLGTGFATLIGHLTSAVPAPYAPDTSGVATTTLQIGGPLGGAAFGSLYLSLAAPAGPTQATHAFAVTSLTLGGRRRRHDCGYLTTHSHGVGRCQLSTHTGT